MAGFAMMSSSSLTKGDFEGAGGHPRSETQRGAQSLSFETTVSTATRGVHE